MSTYKITERGAGDGFDIEIAGEDGARQTMLGFSSREEAERWIVEDARLSAVGASNLRLLWRQ